MKTATKIASVLAVLCGISVMMASEAQAGGKGWGGKGWSGKIWTSNQSWGWKKPCYRPRPYLVIRRCHEYHYGFCSYYKRYGFCRYFVPGPVGGPPVVGTLPAPGPGGPVLGQPNTAPGAAIGQPAAATNPTDRVAATTPADDKATEAIDPAQLAAIVAAVRASMEQPKAEEEVVEQPSTIDPEILKALELLIDQKLAAATDNTEPPLPEVEQVSEESEPESNNSDLEALRTMLAELVAQQKTEK